MQRCHIAQWYNGLKRSGKAGMPFRTTPMENNTVLLLSFPVGCWSPVDCAWVISGGWSMSQNCVPHSPWHSVFAAGWIPHEILVVQQWHRYAVAQALLDRYQREGDNFLVRIAHTNQLSTAVGQEVACTPVTQRARIRSPVGTSFLGDVFSEFFLTCKTNVRKLYAHKVPEYHMANIIIHHHFITGANDLRCWRALKPKYTYIHDGGGDDDDDEYQH